MYMYMLYIYLQYIIKIKVIRCVYFSVFFGTVKQRTAPTHFAMAMVLQPPLRIGLCFHGVDLCVFHDKLKATSFLHRHSTLMNEPMIVPTFGEEPRKKELQNAKSSKTWPICLRSSQLHDTHGRTRQNSLAARVRPGPTAAAPEAALWPRGDPAGRCGSGPAAQGGRCQGDIRPGLQVASGALCEGKFPMS